jgi:predicted AlkP superfamily phosphohydrolase/phosphomutase
MEMLIIGIDGGDRRIIEAMDMPFMQKLIGQSTVRELEEDLYTRGWSQMLTGLNAPDAKNIYMHPVLDGTHRFSFSFGNKDMAGKDYVKTLPELVNEAGKSIGIMNVPTTFPAEKVDGFVVAGGGGGMDTSRPIPPGSFYPESVEKCLKKHDYKFDLRLKSSGIKSLTKLVEALNEVVRKRTDTFIDLCQQHSPDVGFLCYRVTTDIQYLAMSEIEAYISIASMPEIAGRNSNLDAQISDVQKEILAHYRFLDAQIQRVFEALQPTRHLISSDHSAAPWLYTGNLDAFLLEKGYQSKAGGAFNARKFIVSSLRKLIPLNIRKKIRTQTPLNKMDAGDRFSNKLTKAFSHTYVKGIYVNDTRRFNGPIHEGEEMDQLVDQLVKEFNEDPRAKEIGLVAKPYRREHEGARFYDHLPDVMVDGPGTIFYKNNGPFVGRNDQYGPLTDDLSHLTRDMVTGQKGTDPLFIVDNQTAELLGKQEHNDLRLVYSTVEKVLSC